MGTTLAGACNCSTFLPETYAYPSRSDWLVGNITKSPINTTSLTNTSTFSGTTSYAGFVYTTSISYVSGLLGNTSIGVNHNTTVGVNGANAIDGLVAVLDVKITTTPSNATSSYVLCCSP